MLPLPQIQSASSVSCFVLEGHQFSLLRLTVLLYTTNINLQEGQLVSKMRNFRPGSAAREQHSLCVGEPDALSGSRSLSSRFIEFLQAECRGTGAANWRMKF